MGTIYSKSRGVISWLGRNRHIERAFNALMFKWHHQQGQGNTKYISKHDYTTFIKDGLRKLNWNEYWNRAWITQEIALAVEITLLAGYANLALQEFPGIWKNPRSKCSLKREDIFWNDLCRHVAENVNASSLVGGDLFDLLNHFNYKACGVRRDRI